MDKPHKPEAAETVQTTSVLAVDLPRLVLGSSDTPRTDKAEVEMDKADLRPLLKLPLYANLARNLEKENRAMFMAGYSASYILEELNNEPGMWQMAKLTGLPMGVIVDAFANICGGAEFLPEKSDE